MIDIGKILIISGIIIIAIGIVFLLLKHTGIPLGKLPGDIIVKRENFTFYFPIVTSIIISIILSLILFFIFGKK